MSNDENESRRSFFSVSHSKLTYVSWMDFYKPFFLFVFALNIPAGEAAEIGR